MYQVHTTYNDWAKCFVFYKKIIPTLITRLVGDTIYSVKMHVNVHNIDYVYSIRTLRLQIHKINEPVGEKKKTPTICVPTRSDTNRAVQLQKMVRG